MKKIVSIISAIALILSFTGCAGASSDDFAGMNLVNAVMERYMLWTFNTLEELEEHSEIAVVGTFVGETTQQEFYETLGDREILANVISTNTIEVSRVIKGDVAVGDKINIIQRYGVFGSDLVFFDRLTPMQKGDEWVFFLRRSNSFDGYICRGDTDGRYPTRNVKSNRAFSLSEYSELGVYDEADFKWDIYNELVEKYGI